MRARLSGSTITAHGDNLGSPYVEFYGNEPAGFPTNWTVTGSSPNRVLVDPNGHAFSPELPDQTAPSSGGGSVTVTGSQGGGPFAATELELAGTVSESSPGTTAQSLSLFYATVVLTDAEIKTLASVGKEIVAAPGAGRAILPIMATFVTHIPAASYTGGGGDYLTVGTGVDDVELITISEQILNATAIDRVHIAVPQQSSPNAPVNPPVYTNNRSDHMDNAALTISISGSDPTGGASGNTITVAVAYLVLVL